MIDKADIEGWMLVTHCCRACMGRIAQKGERFRCTGCGVESIRRPHAICGCGIKVNAKHHHRCAPNEHRTPGNPHEVIILFNGQHPEHAP